MKVATLGRRLSDLEQLLAAPLLVPSPAAAPMAAVHAAEAVFLARITLRPWGTPGLYDLAEAEAMRAFQEVV